MNHYALPPAREGLSAMPSTQGEFCLVDAYAEGFQLLHMIRLGDTPLDRDRLVTEVSALVERVRKRALAAGLETLSVEDAGYAICAAIDEAILASACNFRAQWESHPLQLSLFGDQLAGEHFFDRLDRLRERGRGQLPIVEVFHMCLTLGFRGRYHLDGEDKRRFLIARLADEIAQGRQESGPLAPHWAPPDVPQLGLRYLASALVIFSFLASAIGVAWVMVDTTLHRRAAFAVDGYENLVQLPAGVAHVSIKLP